MRAFLVGVAVAGALLACSSVNDVAAGAQLSLTQHQARWAQRSFSTYSFDLVQEKFGLTTNVRVTVTGTAIVGVIDKSTGLPPTIDAGWPTIDELYSDAQSVIGVKNTTLQMAFDEQYSYPTLVEITSFDPGGPYSAHLSNLVPAP